MVGGGPLTREGVGYLRISDDREGLERGVDRQRADITAKAKRERVKILRWYEDNDRGASRHSRRPRKDYLRMLEDARAGLAGQVIYSYSNSRLTRRPRELEDLLDLHDQTGVQIRTVVSGDDNLSTADGRMMARMKVTVDAGESDRISERVKRETRERAEAGRPHGGRRAFGWTADGDLDADEQAVIVEVSERLLNGESLRSVVRDLNGRGVSTVTGAQWSTTVVRQMLTSPRTIGYTSRGGERVARASWEPALDEDTWRELRALLLDESRASLPRAGRRSLLVGLALCGECERPVSSHVTKRQYDYVCHDCRLWRVQEPVDRYIEGVMVVFLEHAIEAEPEPQRVNAQQRKVDRLRRKIAATMTEFTGSEDMTPGQLRELMRDLNAKLSVEEAKLLPPRRRRLQAGLAGAGASERWYRLTLDQKRANIADLLEIRLFRTLPGGRRFDEKSVGLRRR